MTLFEPDAAGQNVTERITEVTPSAPDLSPTAEDLKIIEERYVAQFGVEDEWTANLVSEITGVACNSNSLETDLRSVAQDPSAVPSESELADFVQAEILPRCQAP